MLPRPSAGAERWLAAAARFELPRDPWLESRTSGWRNVSWLLRAALWLVGLIAAALLCGMFELLHVGHPLLIGGALLVGSAELLIAARRVLAGGLEEAFFSAGLLVIAFGLTYAPSSSRESVVALAISAALLLSAWRLLNPMLAALAACASTIAVAAFASHDAWGGDFHSKAMYVSMLCFFMAAAALAAGARRWQRPAVDAAFDYSVIILPICGYGWACSRAGPNPAAPEVLLELMLPAAFAAGALLIGLRRRAHAPVIAAMGCIACIAQGLQSISLLRPEARLIAGGLIVLVFCAAAGRWLRTPRRGITSQQLHATNEAFDLLQMAAIASLPGHQAPKAAPPEFKGGGGQFGGGGADGNF
jgi:hypothetical protein